MVVLCVSVSVRVVVWVDGVRVYGEGQEKQEGDEPALCSMEMELYCSAADCLIVTLNRRCLQEGGSRIHIRRYRCM